MRCCVSLCKNDSRHISKSQGITFHVIPTEPTLRSAWLKALGKEISPSPTERSAVCSEHFVREDLYETKKGLRKVRPGAVPVVGEDVTSCVFGEVESLKVCRICLDTDSKLLEMRQYKLEQAYEQLTGIMVRDDSLPQRLCPECAQRLLNCDSFRRKSLRAYALMLEVVDKQNLLTTDNIKTINRNNNELTSSLRLSDFNIDKYDLEVKHVEEVEEVKEVKKEKNVEIVLTSEVTIKNEVETDIDDDGGSLEYNYSSDDSRAETTEVDPLLEVQRRRTKANINNETRATIITLHKSGLNKTQISKQTGVNRNTVSLWIKRYEKEGSLASRQRSGRPPLISEAQRRHMVGEYETNGLTPTRHFAQLFYTSSQTVRRALHAEGFSTSSQTVRRALHAEGLHHKRPAKKLFLTEKHKEERLRFAREYLDFDWNTTIFSDEVTFKSSQKNRLHLWRKDNARWSDKNETNTDSDRIMVNMWGWMSAAGPGELAFIPPRANSSTYVYILEDIMLPTVRNIYPVDDLTEIRFVQDNCPIHRASIVREWFHNHPEIIVVPWPARSPDLNPIENLWSLMLQRWDTRDERCTTQFTTHCMEVWENLRGTEICQNIVGFMRNRLLDCIENNGGYTKY